jgi:hypothetical protein
MRDYVTRREYDAWISECASLAIALGYPLREEMINDNVGLVLGTDQYGAFINGMWSREPYEVFAIFQALNEPAVDNLPTGGEDWAPYGGLCDKLMIVHPGKFCSPHFHWRKTECYEVVLGEMDLFYNHRIVDDEARNVSADGLIAHARMPEGSSWPAGVALPAGREGSYDLLGDYRRLRPGDAKFIMHRKHLHAFRCPPESRTPLVIREISTYSHEPTDSGAPDLYPPWSHLHDNCFLCEAANTGRLHNRILEAA